MLIKLTGIEDLLIFEPKIIYDERGAFFESYNKSTLLENNINNIFVQDNQSLSNYGVIRGLHFQTGKYAQTKLVSVIKGKILDVVVDLRANSKTFGKIFSIDLSDENKLQLYIPKGFAHGFSVLSHQAIVLYKCDSHYDNKSESGIIYNDSELNIDWQVPSDKIITSQKDLKLQTFQQYREAPCF